MMLAKYSIIGIVALIFIIGLTENGLAITASIGNARAIVNQELKNVPTVLERSIKVNNPNNETVKINITVAGDVKDLVEIIDKEFSLSPGDNKEARYKVMLKKPGNYEIRLIVVFTSGSGQSVGLSSVLIVKAFAKGELPEELNPKSNITEDDLNYTDNGVDIKPKQTTKEKDDENKITGGQALPINLENNGFVTVFVALMIIVVILGGYYFLKRT